MVGADLKNRAQCWETLWSRASLAKRSVRYSNDFLINESISAPPFSVVSPVFFPFSQGFAFPNQCHQ